MTTTASRQRRHEVLAMIPIVVKSIRQAVLCLQSPHVITRAVRRSVMIFAILAVSNTQAQPVEVAFEDEPVLDSLSLAPAALLSGPGFSVDTRAEIRGYMAHFILDTPLGQIPAESVEILAERAQEMPALQALDRVSRSDAFASATANRAMLTARTFGRVFMHPVDTLLEVPAGVARYIGGLVGKYQHQAQSVSDYAARHLGTNGNPYPPDVGPMTAARDTELVRARKNAASRVAAETRRELKRQIKYSQVKRDLAKNVGVDPYTRNPEIQERLDRLAWIGSSGDFITNAVFAAIGGTAGTILSNTGQINTIVWSADPDQLRDRIERRLDNHVSDPLLIRQFLRRGTFTPIQQIALADALDTLQPQGGCEALLELAMTANSELESRFLINALHMLVANVTPGSGRLRTIGAGLVWQTSSDEVILPLPVDYLSWTQPFATFVDRAEFRDLRKSVLIGGNATPTAEEGLRSFGWKVSDRVRWTNAPVYADAQRVAERPLAKTATFPLDANRDRNRNSTQR